MNSSHIDGISDIGSIIAKYYGSRIRISPKERHKIINKFKEYVINNKYMYAMYLIETYNNLLDLTNIIFNDGNNVLHWSVINKNRIFTIFLLQNGLDINIENTKTGNTPFHMCMENNDVKMAGILIRWKSDIHHTNRYNKTPLSIAMQNNNKNMIKLISNDYVKIKYFGEFGVGRLHIESHLEPSYLKLSNESNITSNITDTFDKMPLIHKPGHLPENSLSLIPAGTPANDISQECPVDATIEYLKTMKKLKVPIIQGWILMQCKHNDYKKIYMGIKYGNMVWNNKKIRLFKGRRINRIDKAKWKGHISLLFLKENGIKSDVDSFELIFNSFDDDIKQEISYKFKCLHENDIIYWLNGINRHMEALMGEFDW